MYEKKYSETNLSDEMHVTSVDNLLTHIEDAVRKGNAQDAYQLSLKATQAAPENIEGWLMRASLANSLDERIHCMNRLSELEPDHHDRHNSSFFALKELLDRDPFLGYLEETERLYRVHNADHVVLNIPKRRSTVSPYPHQQKDKLATAHRWLVLAIFGLLLAGIGTLIFAPLAAFSAIDVNQFARTRSEQVGALVVMYMAALLFMIGLLVSILFVMHLIG